MTALPERATLFGMDFENTQIAKRIKRPALF
jgi:hypothetical protein